jgi:hypothetical protein
MYFAVNSSGSRTLVIVGVDELGNDITDGLIANKMGNNPPIGSEDNPLNS